MKPVFQNGMLSDVTPRTAARWVGAGTIALALHGGGLWYSGGWNNEDAPDEPPPSVVMLDLAPVVVEGQAVAAEEAPAVETAETVTEMASTEEIEPVVEQVQREPIQQAMAPIEEIPEAPEAPKPEVVVPKRVERVQPVEKTRPKAVQKQKPVERQKAVRKPQPDRKAIAEKKIADAARQAAAAKAAAGKAAATSKAAAAKAAKASAARTGGGSGISVASWGSKVNAHMQRRKKRGGVSGSGTAYVSFSINGSGGVTSAFVARSSGNPSIDSAAIALVRGASPVPAPPHDAPRRLTIPIQY